MTELHRCLRLGKIDHRLWTIEAGKLRLAASRFKTQTPELLIFLRPQINRAAMFEIIMKRTGRSQAAPVVAYSFSDQRATVAMDTFVHVSCCSEEQVLALGNSLVVAQTGKVLISCVSKAGRRVR